ncbi:MAG TPA: hypothetical protein VLG14_15320 [Sphingomonas sp.]|jgi:ABC-type polysaccharide/polyol phosphate export permease|nr:hypothetical protein [Sphingomonas sp.]
MGLSKPIRVVHRWVSLLFAAVVIAIFAMLGLGHQPVEWVYYLPLPPLAFLLVTGLYMFFRPYFRRRAA